MKKTFLFLSLSLISMSLCHGHNINDDIAVNTVDDNNPTNGGKKTWSFSYETDEMTDSKNIWASLKSDNVLRQNSPYQGDTYAKITVRYMKKYGYDVIIEITKGQIIYSHVGGNVLTIRFDSDEPRSYSFNSSADHDPKCVFLYNVKDFIKRAKKAKTIKLQIPVYHSGNPIFTFTVDEPLVWSKN